jgi:hypothetical protein
LVKPLKPWTSAAPPNGTSATRRSSPGSKRTAVPEGMFKRRPKAAPRSKARAGLTSKKWAWEPTWTGRSPVLRTTSSLAARPALAVIGSSASR